MAEQTFAEIIRESRIFYRRRLAEKLLRDCIKDWRFRDSPDALSGLLLPLTNEQLAARAFELADELSKKLFAVEDKELRGDPASPTGAGRGLGQP